MQYDLGREAAKISAFLFKDVLERYKYLTDEDLGHKRNVFEKARFEYYPFGMTFINDTKNKTNKNEA